jgi:hypothetical protein
MNCIDYVLLLSLDTAITNFPENVLIGAIYLPPENFRFFTIDELICLKTMLLICVVNLNMYT